MSAFFACRSAPRPSAPSAPPAPSALAPLLLALALLCPAPASAQFGALEALARNVTDLSFFGGVGGLVPAADEMAGEGAGNFSFGVELLFEIASVERPIPGARRPVQPDSVRLAWTRMEVVRSEEGVDTVYYYDVQPVSSPPAPTETIWSVELGIGYGQISGFDLADPSLKLRGSVRDLPAASVYASYEPWSTYFGIRTGFMRTKGLQVLDRDGGESFDGDGEAFLAAGLLGYAWSLSDFWAFLESAYTIRYFPSVQWSGGALPAGVPTDLRLSGWSVTAGIQFPIK